LNTFYGNGSATSKSPSPNTSSNFGLGLLGVSQSNLIENNKIGGNINGVYLGGGGSVTGNIIRDNFIAGNPPIQVSSTFGSAIGADIQDFSAAGANTFNGNYCLSYVGASPSPCPSNSETDTEDLQGALKPASLDSLFNQLWALVWPRTGPQKAAQQLKPVAEAALTRSQER
jgi:hypothetical protein